MSAPDDVLVGKIAAAISQVFDRTLAPEQRGRPPMKMDYDAARAVITVYENHMKEENPDA